MADDTGTTTSTPTPTPEPAAASGSAQPGLTASGLTPNLAAALATIPLIGGIAFLILEKQNKLVRFYAMQSAIIGIAWLAFSIFLSILVRIPILGLLFALVSVVISLGFFVLWILTLLKAYSGVEWEIPIVGPIARKQLATSPI